jgi:hypothetical protein
LALECLLRCRQAIRPQRIYRRVTLTARPVSRSATASTCAAHSMLQRTPSISRTARSASPVSAASRRPAKSPSERARMGSRARAGPGTRARGRAGPAGARLALLSRPAGRSCFCRHHVSAPCPGRSRPGAPSPVTAGGLQGVCAGAPVSLSWPFIGRAARWAWPGSAWPPVGEAAVAAVLGHPLRTGRRPAGCCPA